MIDGLEICLWPPVSSSEIPYEVITLVEYIPQFTLDYVISRFIIGHDIENLPKDHIANVFEHWYSNKF